jgi:hypothetical protein
MWAPEVDSQCGSGERCCIGQCDTNRVYECLVDDGMCTTDRRGPSTATCGSGLVCCNTETHEAGTLFDEGAPLLDAAQTEGGE